MKLKQDRECVACHLSPATSFWLCVCLSVVSAHLHSAAFYPARCIIASAKVASTVFPARLTDSIPERALKALLALIAISLRSNMPVLIVLKCNQGLGSGGANNLNLTKRLRWLSSWPS